MGVACESCVLGLAGCFALASGHARYCELAREELAGRREPGYVAFLRERSDPDWTPPPPRPPSREELERGAILACPHRDAGCCANPLTTCGLGRGSLGVVTWDECLACVRATLIGPGGS